MSRQRDRAYYASRAAVERELSELAVDPAVAKVHAQMAERYERLTLANSAAPPLLRIVTA